MRVTRLMGLLLAGLLLVLAACAGEKVISADELMPPGAVEVMPPRSFVEEMLGHRLPGQFWLRGCTLPGGWTKLVLQYQKKTRDYGYYAVNLPLGKTGANLAKAGITQDEFIRAYKSPGNTAVVGIINLKVLREKGAQVEGGADFVLLGGTDMADYPKR